MSMGRVHHRQADLFVAAADLIGKACPRAFAAAALDVSGLLATSRRSLGVMATVVRLFDRRRRSGIRQPIAHSCGRRVA
jgi:hypothetical protein